MTTTPEANDLSHLSDEEFNALCPQGEHAPGPEPLSPAAQAVLDALGVQGITALELVARGIAVAAYRALADQVVPEKNNFIAVRIRTAILAIATKLEGQ